MSDQVFLLDLITVTSQFLRIRTAWPSTGQDTAPSGIHTNERVPETFHI